MKKISIKMMLMASIAIMAVSCKKENSSTRVTEPVSSEIVASVQAIAVAVSSATGDSIYIVNVCERRSLKDSIAFGSLPGATLTYLLANYAGYTSQKAFVISDSAGTVTGYVAIIVFNGKPVGLRFDATGAFLKVLEQREGHDLVGEGWHHGGCFDDRGGALKDTIALSSLPASITTYYTANFPQDTLIRAFQNRDSSIVVLSINDGVFATVFSASGSFMKRVQLPSRTGHPNAISITSLPSAAQAYLTTTYPNYVLKHGFRIINSNGIQGYVVFIDANSTKYAVEFDASGNFIKAVTIR